MSDLGERFMEDHRWAPGHMSDYLDGDLASAGRERMERHLLECEPCRALLESLTRTVEALRRVSSPAGGVDAYEIAGLVRARLDQPA